mgnify:CR=1 FL=1
MRWVGDNKEDVIQQFHLRGEFYEEGYLKVMKDHCPDNATIIDVGANIGNHTVYFSKFFNAKTVYAIEPIPRSYKLLLANLALNYCHNVNVDHIGLALGNQECLGYPCMIYGKDNLGATLLNPVPYTEINDNNRDLIFNDPVNIVTGDSLFKDVHVDLIKIDVERMELVVLEGFKETIKNNRPLIFIEIFEDCYEDFKRWAELNRYKVEFGEYDCGCYNFLMKAM